MQNYITNGVAVLIRPETYQNQPLTYPRYAGHGMGDRSDTKDTGRIHIIIGGVSFFGWVEIKGGGTPPRG